MMEWHKLLCEERFETGSKSQKGRTEFERDFDRIVFSTAFRRLQNKTQVMPLPEMDFVHNRLTHSLEASCVGRSLGKIVGDLICKKYKKLRNTPFDFSDIVAAATLAHDIGNPPFGHSGEDAISDYFKSDKGSKYIQGFTEAQKADLQNFEGNALGFSLLTRTFVSQSGIKGGLRLTYATVGSFCKYPRESLSAVKQGETGASDKKPGYFQKDKESFRKLAKKLSLIRKKSMFDAWVRHPLAFLVEAADDICYRIMDLEDGYRLRLYGLKDVQGFLLVDRHIEKNYISIHHEHEKVGYLRAKYINRVIQQSAKVFIANEHNILRGTFDKPLIDVIPEARRLEDIRQFTAKNYYKYAPKVEIEVAGFKIIGGLLDAFLSMLFDDKRSPYYMKIRDLMPSQYFLNNKKENFRDPYEKIIHAVAYVASMTDTYAIDLFRKIYGISLPGE